MKINENRLIATVVAVAIEVAVVVVVVVGCIARPVGTDFVGHINHSEDGLGKLESEFDDSVAGRLLFAQMGAWSGDRRSVDLS